MKERPFGKPEKLNVMWLLFQFLGLADALRSIHNLESPDPSADAGPGLRTPAQEARKSAWHHDLKPENILFYRESGDKHGRFMIADFGTGKVSTSRSRSMVTRSINGTLTYEPPEADYEGATSRPYDVWSMGCVFLELLIWAVLGFGSLEAFHSQRLAKRRPEAPKDIKDDSFWQYEGTHAQLRASVSTWLQKFTDETQNELLVPFQGALLSVCNLVTNMLNIDRKRRIKAVILWNTLDSIYKQTKIDLERQQQDSSLPRLSTKASEEQRTEPSSPTFRVHRTNSPATRSPWNIDAESLTIYPHDSSLARGHTRNNSASGTSEATSDLSSTHAQDGSSLHSHGSRRPSTPNTYNS